MSEVSRRTQFPLLPELGDLLDPFHLLWSGRPSATRQTKTAPATPIGT